MDDNNSSSQHSQDTKSVGMDSLEESEAEKNTNDESDLDVINCGRYSISYGNIPEDAYLSKRDSTELYTPPINLFGDEVLDIEGTVVHLRAVWDHSKDSKEEEEYIVLVSSKTGFSIRQVFSLLDVRKENAMTLNHFKAGLSKIGFDRAESTIESIFKDMDSEGLSFVDEETFVEWVNSTAKKGPSMWKQELLQTGAQAVEDYKNLKKDRDSVHVSPKKKQTKAKAAKSENDKMLEMMAEYKQLHRMDTRTFKIFRKSDADDWTRDDMLDAVKEMRDELDRLANSTPPSTTSLVNTFARKNSTGSMPKTSMKGSFFSTRSLTGRGSIGGWAKARKNSLPREQAPASRKRSGSAGFRSRTRSGSLGSAINNIFSWKPKKTANNSRAESPAVIPSALFFSRAQQDEIRTHLMSIFQSGSVRVKRGRLMIMGPPQCGKTALWRSLNNDKSYRDLPTPGIVKRVLNISQGVPVSTKLVPLQDTLARMTVRQLRSQHNGEGSSPRSKTGDSELPNGLDMATLLNWELIRNYCSKTDEELEDPETIYFDCYEYSGLRQYWGMYHHFISRAGILLMVLSCRDMADSRRRKNTLLYFEQVFALISRVALGTPIVIVATNWECAGIKELIEIDNMLVSTLNSYPAWKYVKHSDEKKLTYYTIDNLSKAQCYQSAGTIRRVLTEILLDDGGDRIMPIEWFQVYNWILQQRESGTKSVLKLSDIHAQFPNIGKLDGLLSLLSDLGVVLYFRKWSFCETFCVIQPNKFLSLLNTFLRPPISDALKCDSPPPTKLYRKLRNEGVFSLEMLKCFESSFAGEYEFMKHILQRLGIVSPWNSQTRFTLELSEFLVPALVPEAPIKAVFQRRAELINIGHILRVVINPVIPWGFRQRFLGRLVRLSVLTKEGSRKLLLSQPMSLITIGYDEFIIETLDSPMAIEASRSFNIVAPFSTSAGRILEHIMKVSDLTVSEYVGTTYSIKLGKQEIDYMEARKAKEDGKLEERLAKWFDSSL